MFFFLTVCFMFFYDFLKCFLCFMKHYVFFNDFFDFLMIFLMIFFYFFLYFMKKHVFYEKYIYDCIYDFETMVFVFYEM